MLYNICIKSYWLFEISVDPYVVTYTVYVANRLQPILLCSNFYLLLLSSNQKVTHYAQYYDHMVSKNFL